MPFSVAQAAIDYLKRNSEKQDSVYLSFYGGEPLLRYDFIKSCVEYAEKTLKKKNISYSITTNGTLINSENAEFFFNNNFSVCISIDGPQEIHDMYRKDFKGNGSFNKTIKGLKHLIHTFGKSSVERISLSIVYAPPFSEKKINRITELWVENPWIPENISVQITYPLYHKEIEKILHKERFIEDKNLGQWAREEFFKNFNHREVIHPISKSIVEKMLAILFQRPIYEKPIDKYPLNACCLPGVRKIYVDVEGNFHVCERISSFAPLIGNVNTGIRSDVIQETYIDKYEKWSLPLCSECWAIRICNQCYVHIFSGSKIDINIKKDFCKKTKSMWEEFIKLALEIVERNPKGLNYLKNYKII